MAMFASVCRFAGSPVNPFTQLGTIISASKGAFMRGEVYSPFVSSPAKTRSPSGATVMFLNSAMLGISSSDFSVLALSTPPGRAENLRTLIQS